MPARGKALLVIGIAAVVYGAVLLAAAFHAHYYVIDRRVELTRKLAVSPFTSWETTQALRQVSELAELQKRVSRGFLISALTILGGGGLCVAAVRLMRSQW